MSKRGYAMGMEHRGKGVDVQLGPVAGPLGRDPEGGRNWEGFSPDPVLTGVSIAQTIMGIQDAGVIACAKHFILVGSVLSWMREDGDGLMSVIRMSRSITVDSSRRISMTRLCMNFISGTHGITLGLSVLMISRPFADAVKAGVGSVMCSYNQINNSYACQNSWTLNRLLKGELDFQGFGMFP